MHVSRFFNYLILLKTLFRVGRFLEFAEKCQSADFFFYKTKSGCHQQVFCNVLDLEFFQAMDVHSQF